MVAASFCLDYGFKIILSKQISKEDLHNKTNFHCPLCRLVGMRASGSQKAISLGRCGVLPKGLSKKNTKKNE